MNLATIIGNVARALSRALDSTLAVPAPQYARNRMLARVQYQHFKRAWEAGNFDRTAVKARPTKKGPIQKTRDKLDVTRAEARELYQTNPYARGTVNSIAVNLIGCGIKPQAKVLKPRILEPNEKFNDLAQDEWKRLADGIDSSGRESYYEEQMMVAKELIIAGEVLLHLKTPPKDDKRRVPLVVDVIPSERLAMLDRDSRAGANPIVQGVEFDAVGRVVAYHIYPNHPGDSIVLADRPTRVPAAEILHLAERLEPGQVRGMTSFMTVAGWFDALLQLLDNELSASRTRSVFALAILQQNPTTQFVDTGNADDAEDEEGNRIGMLEGPMIFHGRPGESVQGIGPSIQVAQVEQFVMAILRAVARGLDVPYEMISADLSKVTYLSARQGENQARRHWEPKQEKQNRNMNLPVWREFIQRGIMSGRLPAKGSPEDYCECDFVRPGGDWIDPSKDIEGDIAAVRAGFRSPMDVIAKRGGDPWKILNDRAQFEKWAKELGIELSISQPEKGAVAPANEPAKKEEETDDDEDKNANASKAA